VLDLLRAEGKVSNAEDSFFFFFFFFFCENIDRS
jgi:hypothetical protein